MLLVIFAALLMMLGSVDKGNNGLDLWLSPMSSVAASALGPISGVVFNDGNNNGLKDTAEVGYAYLTINAFDVGGNLADTTTTDANGNYMLNNLTIGQSYRVELQLPTGYSDAAFGSASGTSVQFATASTNGTQVNFGIYVPNQCTPEMKPRLIAGCVRLNSSSPGVLSWSYLTRSTTFTGLLLSNHDIDADKVGVPWAFSALSSKHLVFFSPIAADNPSLLPPPPDDISTIYVADYSGSGYAFQSYKKLISLQSLGVNVSDQFPVNMNNIGEFGLGGIEVSDDGKTLYVINEGNGKIVKLDISGVNYASLPGTAPTSAQEIPIPASVPNCVNGRFRPTALKIHASKFYVGGVCDGAQGTNDVGLKVKVLEMDTMSQAFTETFSYDPTSFKAGTLNLTNVNQVRWKSSFLVFNELQPVVSSLAIDDTGSLIIGITSRKLYTNASSVNFAENFGYIVRTWREANGSFTLENNRASGPFISTARIENFPPRTPANRALDVGGPGHDGTRPAWFFEQALSDVHFYLFSGGTYVLPGTSEVVAAFTDPLEIGTFGARYLNWQSGQTAFGTTVNFGKLFALTGINAICDAAPIEVGNRVWTDTNSNGIQDAGESPISGVTVRLYDSVNSLLATAVTDTNGNYYFSSASGTNTNNAIYGVAGLKPNTNGFSIKLDNPADYSGSGPLAGMAPATANAGSNDSIDSDGTLVSGFSQTTFNTGSPGANNHTYDFGFRSSTPPPTIICPANIMTMSATSTTSITYPDPMITGTGTTFTCVPPSPFNFPIGTTTVTCTATNAGGSATCSFTVTVKAAKCDTICFRSPQYFLLHLNQLPKGAVVIAGVNYGQAVSTSNTLAIQFALQGNATGIGTLTPLQHFNQEFVAAQLNLVSAGGSGSPTVYNALWSLLSCYKINFTPVTLSNNFTLTPNSTLNDLFEQAISAVRENRTADMGALATIFDLLNGNNPSGHCR